MQNNKNMLLAGALLLIACNNVIGAAERSEHSMDDLSRELVRAACFGKVADVRKLVAAKANVDASSEGTDNSPLHWAVHSDGRLDIVRELITARANIDAANKDGATPLHLAIRNYLVIIARELITARANIDATDKSGNTALHDAIREERVEVVKKLINSRANIAAKNNFGQAPLDVAIEEDDPEMVELLQETQKTREEELEPALGYLVNGPLSVPPLCRIAKDYLL